ncbi:MAG: helix-turn-helix transcriptional regulator [Alphaproteobacteria bacterium]|nr:helix-turn-helix transcriptional regulator [Alphaproteobacteria bacterium SS10]
MTSDQPKPREALGKALREAREKAGLSRVALCQKIGISENTLIRYERAGLEEDGQYPSSQNLAMLCLFLDLHPIWTLLKCVPEEHQEAAEQAFIDYSYEPSYQFHFMQTQYLALLKDNQIQREALRILTKDPDELDDDEKYLKQWLVEQSQEIHDRQEAFDQRMLAFMTLTGAEKNESLFIPGPEAQQATDFFDYLAEAPEAGRAEQRIDAQIARKYREIEHLKLHKKEEPAGGETKTDSSTNSNPPTDPKEDRR